jgi:multiple sugar transport system substrate-binding protein
MKRFPNVMAVFAILLMAAVVFAPVAAQDMAFDGQTIVVVTQTGSAIGGPVETYRGEWEEMTGGRVELQQIAFGELFEKIITALETGSGEYDILIYASDWSGDIMGGGYVIPIPDDIKERVDWEDVLPLYRERIVDWGGTTYALPYDGDSHMMYYRKDLVSPDSTYAADFEAEYGYTLDEPQTWSQYQDIAAFFHGKEVDTAGVMAPINGAVEAQRRNAQSYWFLMSRAGGYAKVPGDPCFFFTCTDDNPMVPTINNPGWAQALQDWIDLQPYAPAEMINYDVTDVRSVFPAGGAVFGLDWGDVGPITVDPNVSVVNDLTGFGVLPGAEQYWDPAVGDWVDAEGGVNQAPFIAFGGWIISVVADSDSQEAALDFAAFMSDKELAGTLATTGGTGVNPLRQSQFDNLDLWTNAGFSEEAATDYLDAVLTTIEHPNAILDIRIPGSAEYFSTLDVEVARALSGEISAQEALDNAAAEWEAITDRRGRDDQLALYRASLGIE